MFDKDNQYFSIFYIFLLISYTYISVVLRSEYANNSLTVCNLISPNTKRASTMHHKLEKRNRNP